MFTGIVQGRCEVTLARREAALTTLSVALEGLTEDLVAGASVSLNGVCATVTQVRGDIATFQLVEETTTLTNLGEVTAGDRVNVERSCRIGDEIGGHVLSGHVACTVPVTHMETGEGRASVSVHVPAPWRDYLLKKGFIALDGASLTIAELDREAGHVAVKLIPETLVRAGFEDRTVGDLLNLEVDSRTQAVVDTVRELMRDRTLLRGIAG